MEEIRDRLTSAVNASGFRIDVTDNRLNTIIGKLEVLQRSGRYSQLLSSIFAANDMANLRSLILEASFAYNFEKLGKPLQYEVGRRQDEETSVDFLCQTEWGKELCIEMRLIQQRQRTTNHIEKQLNETGYSSVMQDGNDDRDETIRMQHIILSKAVNSDGQLIKFNHTDINTYNIVAVEISELHLGMVDLQDCKLALYGDQSVRELERRNIFGLFQEPRPEYPSWIIDIAKHYEPFREAVHAVLFLKKNPPANPIDYDLEYILIRNNYLIDEKESGKIAREFYGVMNVWESEQKNS